MSHALYTRVSTEEQRENQTIRTQLEFGEQYGRLHRIAWAERYEDDGVSGAVPLATRPAGAHLLGDVTAGRVRTVYVWKLDRLGRDPWVILDAIRSLEQAGARVVSMTEPFDTQTPAGRFMVTALAGVAGLERDNIRERCMAGKRRLAREGVIPTSLGRYGALYGYRQEGRDLVIIEAEAAVIREIFRLADTGHTIRSTAVALNERGMLTRAGKIWTASTVRRVLTHEAYCGRYPYGRVEKRYTGELLPNGRQRTRERRVPREEWISIPCPAIVDEALYWRVQAQLQQNLALKNGRHAADHPLAGLVFCGECVGPRGTLLRCCARTVKTAHPLKSGETRVYLSRSYQCQSSSRIDIPYCGAREQARPLETWVAQEVLRQMEPETLGPVLRALAETRLAAAAESRRSAERLARELGELDTQEKRIADVILAGVRPEIVRERLQDLHQRRSALTAQLQGLQLQLAQSPSPESAYRQGEALAAHYRQAFLDCRDDPPRARQFYERLVRVYIHPDGRRRVEIALPELIEGGFL